MIKFLFFMLIKLNVSIVAKQYVCDEYQVKNIMHKAFRNNDVSKLIVSLFCEQFNIIDNDLIFQGMHELLAPLIFVLHCDHQAFLHACELESVG